jgi:hypothetical protein
VIELPTHALVQDLANEFVKWLNIELEKRVAEIKLSTNIHNFMIKIAKKDGKPKTDYPRNSNINTLFLTSFRHRLLVESEAN